ncbi:MAG TPA: hypothetical protein VE011_03785 [Candidatus Dormibacteraeota bacterium]|nr:hypothetical protein [Candidatus Dormibacteraeota bacterium]
MTEARTIAHPATDADTVLERDGDEPVTAERAMSTQAIADNGRHSAPLQPAPVEPAAAAPADAAPADAAREVAAAPLFDEAATGQLRDRWADVQAGFVDQPRSAVEHADALVAEVMQRLAKGFATERQHLEEQWSRGDDVSTEDLRLALQRYRSFFDRLLAI